MKPSLLGFIIDHDIEILDPVMILSINPIKEGGVLCARISLTDIFDHIGVKIDNKYFLTFPINTQKPFEVDTNKATTN